jgi:hypothetical protein
MIVLDRWQSILSLSVMIMDLNENEAVFIWDKLEIMKRSLGLSGKYLLQKRNISRIKLNYGRLLGIKETF